MKSMKVKYFRSLDGGFLRWSVSKKIADLVAQELESGRRSWAALVVEIDEVELDFIHPHELDLYCDVFARQPLPPARKIAFEEGDVYSVNSHWLSRLPAKCKTTKFRKRFLGYVASRPRALNDFEDFY